MFTCTLEAASKTPLCEQLYTALKREMERGGIRPGERMPSKRELAAHLSVSTATVEAAYARLISEGLCESRPRSGIYALEQAQRVGLTDGKKPPVRWNFGTGAADAAHFPYATWARLMREVLSEQSATLLRSGDPQGEPALRREIAGYLHRMRGIDAPPEAIVLGAGTEVLVSALVALIGRERLFAVEDPGYSRVRRILVVSGARMRVVYRARLAALTETVQALNLGSVAPCGAGLYALLHVGGKTPARELAPLAEQAGVHLTRLSDYAVMQNDESRVVLLGFSGMDEDQIRQGLSALKKAWG